jgi:hypothetical protein
LYHNAPLRALEKCAVFLGFFNGENLHFSSRATTPSTAMTELGVATRCCNAGGWSPGARSAETAEQRTIKRRLQHGYKAI